MGKSTALPAGIPSSKLLAAPFPSSLASLVVVCRKLVLPEAGIPVAWVKQD